MASNVNRPKRPFLDTYPDLVQTVQVKCLEYVKDLLADPRSAATATEGLPQPITSQPSDQRGPREFDIQDGFPVMPDIQIDDKLKKEDYEELLRRYLTTHYSECNPLMLRA